MLHADSMLYDHRSAPRETSDQLESLRAKCRLSAPTSCLLLGTFSRERLTGARIQALCGTQCTGSQPFARKGTQEQCAHENLRSEPFSEGGGCATCATSPEGRIKPPRTRSTMTLPRVCKAVFNWAVTVRINPNDLLMSNMSNVAVVQYFGCRVR